MMAKLKFEMEVEVTRLYTVIVFADNLPDAALRCGENYTANDIEEIGESVDHEVNVLGVTRQKGRKMYQYQ